MIRVLYVVDWLGIGGCHRHVCELARTLDRREFEPSVCSLGRGGPVADELAAAGVPVETLGLGRLLSPRAIRAGLRFARAVRERRIDVVHSYLPKPNVFGTFFGHLGGVRGLVASRRDEGFTRSLRLGLIERLLVNPLVDRVVAVCDSIRKNATGELFLPTSKVVAIPNGIDLDRFAAAEDGSAARRRLGIGGPGPVIGTVGHLNPRKALHVLLEAGAVVLRSEPAARFVLVGEGRTEAALRSLAGSLGMADRVIFTGLRFDVPEILRAFDLYVSSSDTEGMSNAVLEAMAAGKAVVATRVGGTPEAVEEGVTGLLVPPSAPGPLAEAILALLRDPQRRAAFGRAGRERAVRLFDVKLMARRYEALYRELACCRT